MWCVRWCVEPSIAANGGTFGEYTKCTTPCIYTLMVDHVMLLVLGSGHVYVGRGRVR